MRIHTYDRREEKKKTPAVWIYGVVYIQNKRLKCWEPVHILFGNNKIDIAVARERETMHRKKKLRRRWFRCRLLQAITHKLLFSIFVFVDRAMNTII